MASGSLSSWRLCPNHVYCPKATVYTLCTLLLKLIISWKSLQVSPCKSSFCSIPAWSPLCGCTIIFSTHLPLCAHSTILVLIRNTSVHSCFPRLSAGATFPVKPSVFSVETDYPPFCSRRHLTRVLHGTDTASRSLAPPNASGRSGLS